MRRKPEPLPAWAVKTDPSWPFGRLAKPVKPKRNKGCPDLPKALF